MIEKIFKAYDVRATYPTPLNEESAWKVGHATAQFLKRSRQNLPPDQRTRLEDSLVIGRDMRPHSPDLAKALADGIRSTGMNVIDVGMVDTSFIYFAVNHLGTVGGIMVTASHNPIQYNGFKISGPKAKPIGSATGLDDIKRIASILRVGKTGLEGKYHQQDLWDEYRKHVLQFLDLKRPLRVVVDASNGMAGKMVPAVFGNLPNLQIIPLLFEITGSFTHDPNPLVEANLDMLKEKMRELAGPPTPTPGQSAAQRSAAPDSPSSLSTQNSALSTSPPSPHPPISSGAADLGVCFDGDADRCFFLDESATTVTCDLITALLAKDFLAQPQNKGSAIVYDLRSSHVVPDEIAAAGGVPKRERVGHAFMKKTLAESKAVFGGELSGHFYFRDNFFADSGAIAFARLLSVLSAQPQPLSALIQPLKRYAHSGEINFRVEEKDAKIRELAEAYKSGKVDYLDGITVDLLDSGWWFNVRKSNTEPLLRLNLEARTPALLTEKLHELQKLLGEPAHGH